MEKINYTPRERDWVDGLLAVLDSARQLLLEMKHSRSVGGAQTLEEFARANGLESALISGHSRVETFTRSRFSVHRIVNSPVKTCRWPLGITPCFPYRARSRGKESRLGFGRLPSQEIQPGRSDQYQLGIRWSGSGFRGKGNDGTFCNVRDEGDSDESVWTSSMSGR